MLFNFEETNSGQKRLSIIKILKLAYLSNQLKIS